MKKKNKLLEYIGTKELAEIQEQYVSSFFKIWSVPDTAKELLSSDRRFSSDDWKNSGFLSAFAATYLLNTRTLNTITEKLSLEENQKEKLNFVLENYMSSCSPANFMATNPEAQKKFFETKGKSMVAGAENFLTDVHKGRISQTDEDVFEVGKNLANTNGGVIFENEVFQLIQYKNLDDNVKEVPILFVPPCINKFYILDLKESSSMVKFALEKGNQVFLISWKNVNDKETTLTWDDYVEKGVIAAVDIVSSISKKQRINTLGFCIGGTLLSCAAGVLAKRNKKKIKSITLMASLLEFSDSGILKIFIDDSSIAARDQAIGQKGIMAGAELATTFSFLRPNDLIWNYYVGNYLKGEKPPAFDLLYWNCDSANLPGPFYCKYLRNFYLRNKLSVPNRLTVCGEQINLSEIDLPIYAMGAKEDHIVPPQSAFKSAQLFGGNVRFVLGASGHIAGCINPASYNKRSFWVNSKVRKIAGKQYKDWITSSSEMNGSWWIDWGDWLGKNNGRLIKKNKKLGNNVFKIIEKAPGRYVKEKAKKL